MNNHDFTLTPRDLLFMHDARPMEASDAGLGANWPRPDQLWNALINMMHRQWPQPQPWEGDTHTYREEVDNHEDSSFRFGALQTVGPFPMKNEKGKTTVYFPCPLDLSADNDGNLLPMELVSADGTDMPAPLKYAFQAPVLGKQQPPPWLSLEDYHKYLNGEIIHAPKIESLYKPERNIGIAINPETKSTIDGRLYQAEYLRLMPAVSMAFSASCVIKAKNLNGQMTDVFGKLMEEGTPLDTIIGGQQGVARLNVLKDGLELPTAQIKPEMLKVRWTLLTPLVSTVGSRRRSPSSPEQVAQHRGGWLPSWISPEDGQVMLKAAESKPERHHGESRDHWRKRCQENAPAINARLVASRVGKPVAFSGWDLNAGQETSAGTPKKTLLAVPAGSCYVFECKSTEDVVNLWKVLDGKRLSSVYGEKGFGFGVCSSYK